MRFFSERPYLISLMLIVLVVVWMFVPLSNGEQQQTAEGKPEKRLQKVQVRSLAAENTELELVFTGRTEPNQQAEIASELDGLLLSYTAERGTMVKKGEPIAQISKGSLEAALAGAIAERNSASTEYTAQSNLAKRGLNAQNGKAAAYATLQAAKAKVQQYETELKKADVLAPFDGLIADHKAEEGDFMGVGKPIATLIDLDPIRAVGDVAERDIADLEIGDKASMVMLNGQKVEGEITYISAFADANTRTFRVEVTLPNTDGKIVGGMTTQVKVPLRSARAYKISPALLTLNAEGDIQVATVGDDNRVSLHEVNIVRSDTDGIWVTGIPETVRIITLGQGFVRDGEQVDPIEEEAPRTVITEANS